MHLENLCRSPLPDGTTGDAAAPLSSYRQPSPPPPRQRTPHPSLPAHAVLDVLSSFPFSTFNSSGDVLRGGISVVSVSVQPHEWLGLLRLLAFGRVVRAVSTLFNTRFIRRHALLAMVLKVVCLLYTYCVMAHYLGLGWYIIAVRPLEADAAFDQISPWIWLDAQQNSPAYITGLRYTCGVYWALSVMSNLKGHNSHETRQCLIHDPLLVNPLQERVYTIVAFILGASFFSFIYGNIANFVTSFYKAGTLHQERLEDADAIAHFHRITPELQSRLRRHVEFTWAVRRTCAA